MKDVSQNDGNLGPESSHLGKLASHFAILQVRQKPNLTHFSPLLAPTGGRGGPPSGGGGTVTERAPGGELPLSGRAPGGPGNFLVGPTVSRRFGGTEKWRLSDL